MALTALQTAAANRITALYNANTYNATTNAGGMAGGGHRTNFVPAIQDVVTFGQGVIADASASATAALTQAGNAAGSATSAANSASAAAGVLTSVNAVYDSFDDRYLGAFASAPTLDNDGNAILPGALYFNTSDNFMRVRTSTNVWLLAYASSAGVVTGPPSPGNNDIATFNIDGSIKDSGITIGTGANNVLQLDASGNVKAPSTTVRGGVKAATAGANLFQTGIDTTGAPIFTQPLFSNLSGVATGAQLPIPSTTVKGGVLAGSAPANQFVNGISSTTGGPTYGQPSFSNLAGVATNAQLPSSVDFTSLKRGGVGIYQHQAISAANPNSGNATLLINTYQTFVSLAFTATGPSMMAAATGQISCSGATVDVTYQLVLYDGGGAVVTSALQNSTSLGGFGGTGICSLHLGSQTLTPGGSYTLKLNILKNSDNGGNVIPLNLRIDGMLG